MTIIIQTWHFWVILIMLILNLYVTINHNNNTIGDYFNNIVKDHLKTLKEINDKLDKLKS